MTGHAIRDVDAELSVVLGKTTMSVKQLLRMGRGAVIVLDAYVNDDVWVLVNDQVIARGKIVITGDSIGVEIADTNTPESYPSPRE